MKFHKVLKKLQKNKKLKASSVKANCYLLSLSSIKFWLCSSSNSHKERMRTFDAFLNADDWIVQNAEGFDEE